MCATIGGHYTYRPPCAACTASLPGPPVVLAGSVAGRALVTHPAAVVARLLATHYADLMDYLHDH